jgi:hypothetical protein
MDWPILLVVLQPHMFLVEPRLLTRLVEEHRTRLLAPWPLTLLVAPLLTHLVA